MTVRKSAGTRKAFSRFGICLTGAAAIVVTLATTSDAQSPFNPVIIRGAGPANPDVLRLAYQASFPDGSLDSSVDHLNVGPMVPGDPLIPDSDPTVSKLPGEVLVSIHRPVGLPSDLIPAESLWATPVNFSAGSVLRISATFRAPVGPLPGGGFAIGLVARTGARDDLAAETRIATTVNVRPGFLVRLNVPFGSTQPTAMVLPAAVRDAIFSTSSPQPFTLSLTIDRVHGTARSQLKVGNNLFTLPFVLADFVADGGPTITAVGPGIAVNSNGPGKTASVHVRDFRIYTNVSG